MKTIAASILTLSLLCTALRADTFGTVLVNGASGTNLTTTGPGGVLFGGTYGSGGIPVEGNGARMMWFPAKAAFRVGLVNIAGLWDNANIGDFSIGLGSNSSASGFAAIAFGSGEASGHTAVALGWGGKASGTFATALGGSEAKNTFTFAAAMGRADGFQSVALGGNAVGNYSTAVGVNAVAVAVSSTVVGQFNEIPGSINPEQAANADPIFVVGTGTGTATNQRKNGFEVRRDGVIKMAKRQGDLGMGRFGNAGDQ